MSTQSNAIQKSQVIELQKLQAYGGLLFVAMAVVSFGAAVYFIVISGAFDTATGSVSQESGFRGVVYQIAIENSRATFLLLGSLLGSILGASLLRSAFQATRQAISEEDRALLEPLITSADENAINQFVRVSSLTGSTGFFAKLGFTGLPLVTAALGLLLILLAMASHDTETSKELMDLAKLVLGAFIGSFVQRKVERNANDDPKPNPEDLL